MPLVTSCVKGFWKRNDKNEGEQFCLSALNQARGIVFYEKWGVPDTLEGRFDCASLHIILLLKHLQGRIGQTIFDTFFSYTELTLREMGVGDLSIGTQVKNCAKFFLGTLKAYHNALEGQINLEDALQRNLYGGIPSSGIKKMAHYVRRCDQYLKEKSFKNSMKPTWPLIEE